MKGDRTRGLISNRPGAWALALGLTASVAIVGSWRAASGGSPQPAHALACTSWKVIRSPTVNDAILHSVSGTSTTDVWAVGDTTGTPPIIEHWNGASWKESTQSGINGTLGSVSAITPTDAWAVGYQFQGATPTLTEHWDGTAWRRVTSPNPGSQDELHGSVAIASDDVWAAGQYLVPDGSTIQPLYLHWDGTTWSHVPEAPGLTDGGIIVRMAATSSSDVWAVGYVGLPTGSNALIE